MKPLLKLTSTLTLASTLFSCSSIASYENTKNLKPMARQAQDALFKDYDLKKVQKYFAQSYIQHNPHIPTGRAPIEGFLPLLKKAKTTSKTHRLIQDGKFIIMHNTYDNAEAFGAKQVATFDIWRIENNKIQEHWDAIQPLTKPNRSSRTLVDGTTKIKNLDKTTLNKKLVRNFYQEVFVEKNKSATSKYISSKQYLQHNPQGIDGIEGLNQFLDFWLVPERETIIHRIFGEGNFVLVQSESKLNDTRLAVYDLFRVENDMIVEHWDIIQEIPKKMAHDNGMF